MTTATEIDPVKYVSLRMPCGKTWFEAINWLQQLHSEECKKAGQEPLAVHIQWAPGSDGFAISWDFKKEPKALAKRRKATA